MASPVRHAHAVTLNALFASTLVVGMRNVEGVVDKKRLALLFRAVTDILQHLVGNQMRGIIPGDPRHAGALIRAGALGAPIIIQDIAQRNLSAIVDHELGVIIVRVIHVDVAVEFVESVALRIIQRRRVANAPFTKTAGLVIVLLQYLGESDIPGKQLSRAVAANARVARVQPRHQHAA